MVKRVSFQIKEEGLWEKFLEAIEGKYENASQAFRSLMRQKIKEKES